MWALDEKRFFSPLVVMYPNPISIFATDICTNTLARGHLFEDTFSGKNLPERHLPGGHLL
jgi:hypothetical protein